MYSFSYLEQSVVPCPVASCCFLTCIEVSQKAGQVVWYSHLFQNFPQFIVIHTVEGFGIVNKAERDVFLELSCFFDDPADIGNLISGSSAFSKTSLIIWNFSVHVLLNFFKYQSNILTEPFLITLFKMSLSLSIFNSSSICYAHTHTHTHTISLSLFSIKTLTLQG